MESSDKRVLGIVTVAIVTTMVTALAILRSQAIEADSNSANRSWSSRAKFWRANETPTAFDRQSLALVPYRATIRTPRHMKDRLRPLLGGPILALADCSPGEPESPNADREPLGRSCLCPRRQPNGEGVTGILRGRPFHLSLLSRFFHSMARSRCLRQRLSPADKLGSRSFQGKDCGMNDAPRSTTPDRSALAKKVAVFLLVARGDRYRVHPVWRCA